MLARRHAEWVAWQSLYDFEPFGPHHDDWRFATLTAAVHATWGRKVNAKAFLHGRQAEAKPASAARSWLRSTAPAYRG